MYFGDLGLRLGLQKINKLINKICNIICKIFWGVLALYIENSSASLIVIDKTSIELLTSKQGYNALQSEYEILNAICAVYTSRSGKYHHQSFKLSHILSWNNIVDSTTLPTTKLFDSFFQFSSVFFHHQKQMQQRLGGDYHEKIHITKYQLDF